MNEYIESRADLSEKLTAAIILALVYVEELRSFDSFDRTSYSASIFDDFASP